MAAFVPTSSFTARRLPPLRPGLRSTCATTHAPSTPCRSHPRTDVSMSMAINPESITLDRLVYNPMPIISGIEDKDLICYNVWKQVFGNAYVMESERAEAYKAESSYRAGVLPLKEFVRAVALTSTYRRRFFECCGPYRAVELNFKHLLGRGPLSQAELSGHVQRIANEGFEAEINSYIDSPEYEEAFGTDYVPYMRFKGTYATCEEFNRMCSMYSSPGTTDKSLTARASLIGLENPNHVLSLDGAGITSKMVGSVAANVPTSFVRVKKGIPSRPDLEHGLDQESIVSEPVINSGASPVRRVEVTMGNYMYLTAEEEAEITKEQFEQVKITGYAEMEIAEAQMQIELLQAKVAELRLITE